MTLDIKWVQSPRRLNPFLTKLVEAQPPAPQPLDRTMTGEPEFHHSFVLQEREREDRPSRDLQPRV